MSFGKKKDEAREPGSEEREATERGFGTGLRAQLQRRQNPQSEEQAPEPAEQSDPPSYVDYEFSSSAASEGSPQAAGELEDLRSQLEEAQKRERELQSAFAEHGAELERRLSNAYDVFRVNTKRDQDCERDKIRRTCHPIRDDERLADGIQHEC